MSSSRHPRPLLGNAFAPTVLSDAENALLAELEAVIERDLVPLSDENDRRGRYPTASIAALKTTGLLKTGVPARLGGPGFSTRFSVEAQVRLAIVDPAVAQLFKIHDEVLRETLVYGREPLRRELARRVLDENVTLGLAVAEAGRKVDDPFTTIAVPRADGGFEITGRKIYTTGAAEADLISVWAYNPSVPGIEADPLLGLQVNFVPRDTAGVTIHRDWNALGMRATDSGSVSFERVVTDPALRINGPGAVPLHYASLRYQIGFAGILVGIAIGALHRAIPFVNERSRPWPSGGVENAADDPYVRRLAGELTADLVAAHAATIAASDLIDRAEEGGIARAAVAGPVYAAKSAASRAALRATSELLSLLGTRAAVGGQGFDRFWRDARTVSLHDPVDWKSAELGRIVLSDWDPPPGVYQ